MGYPKKNIEKLVVMLAVLSLFVTACRTNTTIDTTSAAPSDESPSDDSAADDSAADDSAADDIASDETDEADTADDDADTSAGGDAADDDTADDSDDDVADEDTADDGDAGDDAAGDADDAETGDDAADDTDDADTADDAAGDADDADTGDGDSASAFTVPSELTEEQAAALQAVTEAQDWCQVAVAVDDGTGVLDTADFTDPVRLEQAFTQALLVVSAAQRLAPPEIAGEVATTVEGFGRLTASLEDVGWSFIDLELDVLDDLNSELVLASYEIQKYNFEVCGVGNDPGEPPSPDDLVSPAPGELDGTIRDQAVQGLVQAGFTEEEASCLLDKLDVSDPAAFNDTAAVLNVFTECGLSLDRLGQLGGG